MDELKPCPFCGGAAIYDTDGTNYWVICLVCGAKSRSTCFAGIAGRLRLTQAWNRRTGS